jgi:ADP-heptose:LPS heptosyltransferase
MTLSKNFKAYLLKKLTNKKPVNFDLKDSKNILFIRYDRIGDMLISTPVFREFKLAYPNTNVIVLASEVNKDILLNNPYIDKVIINFKNNLLRDIFSLLRLRKLNIDACVEFDHSVVLHAIIRLRIINPKKIISVQKFGRYGVSGDDLEMYNIYTEKKKNCHFRDIWLDTLKPFGIITKSNKYDLFINNTQEEKALNFLKQFQSKCKIGINLEGAVKGKKINTNELIEICEGIKKINQSAHIIILTHPNNLLKVSRMVGQLSLNYISTSYKTDTILDVAALVKNLNIIITPDTSIVHIASTFDKPIVSIHENNMDSYELFSPISSLHRTIFSPLTKGIEGFDVTRVIEFSNELIKEAS